jgi:O-acetyl-ADP-ribose deacetylase (regulator of RNase III)
MIESKKMIEHTSGNLLDAPVEALVNTVNCVGIMGKGIALQFRQAYPDNYKYYRAACERGEVRPGQMLVYDRGQLIHPRYIINFPTKQHWKEKSRMEYIDAGLDALVREAKTRNIQSIAIPPLGAGSGGLDWAKVKPKIEKAFAPLTEVRVLIYEPQGAPAPERMQVGTEKPRMTPGRAILLGLLESYAEPMYRLTQLEIQKLMYFAQVAGEPLQLHFVKDKYGPYAETLNHVLQRIEGHYIRGYGDRSRHEPSIHLLPNAAEQARAFLQDQPDALAHLERVAKLINGFETPYGMELLATVHWVAQENLLAKTDVDIAIQNVQAWSKHKREHFNPAHIQAAWNRLREQHWL